MIAVPATARYATPVLSGEYPSTCCMYSVRIRNIEKSTVPMMKPATFAAVSVCRRKIENGTSGSRWRCSHAANAPRIPAEAAKTPIVAAEPQPHCWPCVMASTSRTSPEVTSTAPGTSWRCSRESRLSVSRTGVSASAAAPTGTFTKKIQFHDRRSVRTPPRRTPATAPTPPTAPQAPSAMFRSRPSVKVVVTIESAEGVIAAAPRPWIARAPISDASLHARPQSSEPSEKRIRPTTKMRRRPRMSASRPPSRRKPPKTSAYALITHCRFASEKWRSTLIDGSATLTTAMSRTTTNCAAQSSASANHFRLCELSPSMPARCPRPGGLGRTAATFLRVRLPEPVSCRSSAFCMCRNRSPGRGRRGRLRVQGGEALPPARVAQGPTELPLGLDVRRAAGLGSHHDHRFAGEQPGEPGGEAAGLLGPDDPGDLGEPLPRWGGLVVDDVVDRRALVLECEHRRRGRVLEVDERRDAAAFSDDRPQALADRLDQDVLRLAVEDAVAEDY